MEQILLINPSKRPKMRKHRTAAQRAATKRLVALNRSRRRNPVAARKNPSRRRRSHAAPVVHRRRRNPITLFSSKRRHHRRRRNPIESGMQGLIKEGLYGAAGAVLVDVALNWLPLPVSLRAGTMGIVTRGLAALILGTTGRRVFGPAAASMGAGALTVQAYQLVQQYLPAQLTGGMGYVSPGLPAGATPEAIAGPAPTTAGMGMYVPMRTGGGMGMGEYVM